MIRNIIELLPYIKGGKTENIKIAKGKYKLPETWREGMQQLKSEIMDKKNEK